MGRALELAAKRVDQDIERTRSDLFVLPPDPFGQRPPSDDARPVLCQQFQQQELGPGQVDGFSAASHAMLDRVDDKICDGEGRRRRSPAMDE